MDAGAVLGALSVGLGCVALATRRDPAVTKLLRGWGAPNVSSAPKRGERGLLEILGGTSLGRRSVRGDRIDRIVTLAGSPESAERLGGLRIVSAAIGAALAVVLGTPLGMVLAPLFIAAGFHLPVVRLSRAARRRQRSIELRVPDLVEVLVATAEAGLAPTVALSRAPGVLHGPLAEEIETVAAEIRLGLPWRDALEHLVARTDVPSVRRLVVALTRSSRLGSSVRSTLREVADDLRATRRLRAEELARRAPVKMLFPLVFLILPAFLLLTVGPAVLATIRSLQAGG